MKNQKIYFFLFIFGVLFLGCWVSVSLIFQKIGGENISQNLKTSTSKQWHYETNSRIDLVNSDDGQVYICEDSGQITALDKRSGQKKWSQQAACPNRDFYFIPEKNLIISGSSANIMHKKINYYAFNTDTGDIHWTKITNGTGVELHYQDKIILEEIIGNDSRVFQIDLKNGSEDWSVDIPVGLLSTIQISPATNVLFGYKDTYDTGIAFAINPVNGNLLWQKVFSEDISVSAIRATNSVGVLGLSQETYIYDLHTGKEILKKNRLSKFVDVIINVEGKDILILYKNSQIFAVDPISGDLVWNHTLNNDVPRSFNKIGTEGILVFSDSHIEYIDTQTGKSRWDINTLSFRDKISFDNKYVYVISQTIARRPVLSVIDISTGRITKKIHPTLTESFIVGKGFIDLPVVTNHSIYLINLDLWDTLVSGNLLDFHMSYRKRNFDTDRIVNIESLAFGERVFTDDEYFFQYYQTRLVATP